MSKDESREEQYLPQSQTAQMGGRDIKESIKYRRRAQEAERRCAILEAEIEDMRATTTGEADALQAAMTDARRQIDALQQEIADVTRQGDLDRALLRAGACDVETASAIATRRLQAADEMPADLDEFAKDLLEEKPFLKAQARTVLPPIGTSTQSQKAGGASRATVLNNLAETATKSGKTRDVVSYMRLKRAAK